MSPPVECPTGSGHDLWFERWSPVLSSLLSAQSLLGSLSLSLSASTPLKCALSLSKIEIFLTKKLEQERDSFIHNWNVLEYSFK